jgi:hypothetical protein
MRDVFFSGVFGVCMLMIFVVAIPLKYLSEFNAFFGYCSLTVVLSVAHIYFRYSILSM